MNYAFVNNYFEYYLPPGCGLTYWSLGITLQFYALFPLLLSAFFYFVKNRNRNGVNTTVGIVTASMVAFVLSSLYRVYSTASADPTPFPLGISSAATAVPRILSWFKFVYFRSLGRIPSLAAGVVVGTILRSPEAVQNLERNKRMLSEAALITQGLLVFISASPWHGNGTEPAWPLSQQILFGALLHNASPFVALTLSLQLLALALETDPIHVFVGSLLNRVSFGNVLSRWSLGLFLFHPIALYISFLYLEQTQWWPAAVQGEWPGVPFSAVCTSTIALTLVFCFAYERISIEVAKTIRKKKKNA